MIINIPYNTEQPEIEELAFIDTDKTFDEQTEPAKEYILSKQDTNYILGALTNNNRPEFCTYYYKQGFECIFSLTYANEYSWLIDKETVTSIKLS